MAVITSTVARSDTGSRWSPSWRLVWRNYLAHRRSKVFFLTGFLEPVLYLFSIGIGVARTASYSFSNLSLKKIENVESRTAPFIAEAASMPGATNAA